MNLRKIIACLLLMPIVTLASEDLDEPRPVAPVAMGAAGGPEATAGDVVASIVAKRQAALKEIQNLYSKESREKFFDKASRFLGVAVEDPYYSIVGAAAALELDYTDLGDLLIDHKGNTVLGVIQTDRLTVENVITCTIHDHPTEACMMGLLQMRYGDGVPETVYDQHEIQINILQTEGNHKNLLTVDSPISYKFFIGEPRLMTGFDEPCCSARTKKGFQIERFILTINSRDYVYLFQSSNNSRDSEHKLKIKLTTNPRNDKFPTMEAFLSSEATVERLF